MFYSLLLIASLLLFVVFDMSILTMYILLLIFLCDELGCMLYEKRLPESPLLRLNYPLFYVKTYIKLERSRLKIETSAVKSFTQIID